MKFIGLLLLMIFSPVYFVLYISCYATLYLAELSSEIFKIIYEPIYDLAGKPLDQKGEWKWNKRG